MDDYQKWLGTLATLTLIRLFVKDIIDIITHIHNKPKKKISKKKASKTSRKGSTRKR
ncbi:hypothetical protein [Paenibacillus donghaensis]|uniref:hypothetical protein n=1 Tax=Paenibacillus donghaensis TaxID=414771 RepID=UPI0012FDE8CB|nr:hypothetical protein [Paenibacillus donghaensis]